MPRALAPRVNATGEGAIGRDQQMLAGVVHVGGCAGGALGDHAAIASALNLFEAG
jgi:hypothetical protein